MESLNVYTAQPNILALGWAWRFANESLKLQEAESGWNLNPDEVQRFYLRSQAEQTAEPEAGVKLPCILLIEDNPADSGLVREALEEHNVQCELMLITDGESAIQFIERLDAEQQSCPDLVILDLNLPKKPGHQVLQRLRESLRCSHTPLVVLTSSDRQQDREEAARLGASRYIQKPFSLAEFLALGGVFKAMLGSHAN